MASILRTRVLTLRSAVHPRPLALIDTDNAQMTPSRAEVITKLKKASFSIFSEFYFDEM